MVFCTALYYLLQARALEKEEGLRFSEIRKKLKWKPKKVNRYLDRMVESGLLEKKKNGVKGSKSVYKPTTHSYEYKAYHFFEHVRDVHQESGLISRGGRGGLTDSFNESFLIYGIPQQDRLTSLEKKIFFQSVSQIIDAFYNLYSLKQSIEFREKRGEPLDYSLLWHYLLSQVANEVKEDIRYQVLRSSDGNDVERTLQIAKKMGIEIENVGGHHIISDRF